LIPIKFITNNSPLCPGSIGYDEKYKKLQKELYNFESL
jgi:hypothetical protein